MNENEKLYHGTIRVASELLDEGRINRVWFEVMHAHAKHFFIDTMGDREAFPDLKDLDVQAFLEEYGE